MDAGTGLSQRTLARYRCSVISSREGRKSEKACANEDNCSTGKQLFLRYYRDANAMLGESISLADTILFSARLLTFAYTFDACKQFLIITFIFLSFPVDDYFTSAFDGDLKDIVYPMMLEVVLLRSKM